MNKSLMTLFPVFLLLFSCGSGEGTVETTNDTSQAEEQLVSLDFPFDVHSYTPEGEEYIVSFTPGQNVLFYYFLPLLQQEELETDILYLAALDDSSLAVIPLQLDSASRDQAQTIINELNISLPVYQTDMTFYDRFGTGEMPLTVYVVPGEEPVLETGFGSPRRVFDSRGE